MSACTVTKFEIYEGIEGDEDLIEPVLVGFAYLRNGENFYVFNLRGTLPRKLYLARNEDPFGEDYTIYCGRSERTSEFVRPCGVGILRYDLQDYLEIELDHLDYPLFMSLHKTKEAA